MMKKTIIAALLAGATALTMSSAQAWGPFNNGYNNYNNYNDGYGDGYGDGDFDGGFSMGFSGNARGRGYGRGYGNNRYYGEIGRASCRERV